MEKNAMSSLSYPTWCRFWTGVLVCSRTQRPCEALKQRGTLRSALVAEGDQFCSARESSSLGWNCSGAAGGEALICYVIFLFNHFSIKIKSQWAAPGHHWYRYFPQLPLAQWWPMKRTWGLTVLWTQAGKVTGNCDSGRNWDLTFAKVSWA